MLLLLISFVAGILTVLAPCTLSLLPVIVGGTLGGETSYRRAVTVAVSLGVSVILFTFLLKVSSLFLNIPPSVWQYISGGIIILLGLATVFPTLWDKIPFLSSINQSSNKVIGSGFQKQNSLGDILIGAALGPVFSSCSPTYFLILAEVLPRSLLEGSVYLLVYVLGLCGSLLIIAILGQKIMERAGALSDPNGIVKRSIGVIFIVLGIIIIFGYEKKLELYVADHIFDVTKVEQILLKTRDAKSNTVVVNNDLTSAIKNIQDESERALFKESRYSKAPEITNPSGFINTGGAPVTFSQFKGNKVVLVDFWTYSCINCKRTLPYMNAWYDKYHDKGLEIISIHTPEFSFEKVKVNVQNAVTTDNIKYAVVLDNEYGTWNAFGNHYWPRKYLIDIDGYIVYDHSGEGEYDATEKAVQDALLERSKILGKKVDVSGMTVPKNIIETDITKPLSPEIYFGSGRNERLGNGKMTTPGMQTLSVPNTTTKNILYLSGAWNFSDEYAESVHNDTAIIFKYTGKNVYFVASSIQGSTLKITVDGKPLNENRGTDVDMYSQMHIKENRLYNIVNGLEYGEHILRIEVKDRGLQAFTFTFG